MNSQYITMKVALALQRRPKVQIASVWVGSVVLFSFLYWVCWIARPDTFILNKEFNLTPYDHLLSHLLPTNQEAMWGNTSVSRAAISTELDEFMKGVSELDEKATSTLKQLQTLQERQQQLEDSQNAVYQQHSAKLWSNVEKYKANATRKEEEASRQAQDEVSRLESVAGGLPSYSRLLC